MGEYGGQRLAVVVAHQSLDILQEEGLGLTPSQNVLDFKEKRSTGLVGKAETFSGDREGLTGEAAAEDVKILRDGLLCLLQSDVPVGTVAEVSLIGACSLRVYLRAEHAPASQGLHRNPESADTGKEVYEGELRIPWGGKGNVRKTFFFYDIFHKRTKVRYYIPRPSERVRLCS